MEVPVWLKFIIVVITVTIVIIVIIVIILIKWNPGQLFCLF